MLKYTIEGCHSLLTLTSAVVKIKVPLKEGKRPQFELKLGDLKKHFSLFNELEES
ncbi:MAG: hypothetical protein ACP8RL_00715 [cyanobacterium endosymbiont of Rhopalodia inflata]